MPINAYGTIDAHKGYLVDEVAHFLGFDQPRTAARWLDEMQVPWTTGPRGKRVYSGRLIILAIERTSTWPGDDERKDGGKTDRK